MHVDNSGQRFSMLVSARDMALDLQPFDDSTSDLAFLHDRKVCGDHSEDVSVADRCIIESGCVDKCDSAPVEIKWLRCLDAVGARLHFFSYFEVRAAQEINKLRESARHDPSLANNRKELTDVFPVPVGPMILR